MDKTNKSDMNKITNFMFELGQLKRVKRSGWWLAGIDNPESVAEHSFRAGMVAFAIAKLENANPERSALMALMNDLHEARLNDLHKVGHRYINFKTAEASAIREQLIGLPFGDDLLKMFDEFHTDGSKEGIIARDADLLECAVQAKEYLSLGYDVQNWIDNIEKLLKTDTAKNLLEEVKKTQPTEWWKGLKKTER